MLKHISHHISSWMIPCFIVWNSQRVPFNHGGDLILPPRLSSIPQHLPQLLSLGAQRSGHRPLGPRVSRLQGPWSREHQLMVGSFLSFIGFYSWYIPTSSYTSHYPRWLALGFLNHQQYEDSFVKLIIALVGSFSYLMVKNWTSPECWLGDPSSFIVIHSAFSSRLCCPPENVLRFCAAFSEVQWCVTM